MKDNTSTVVELQYVRALESSIIIIRKSSHALELYYNSNRAGVKEFEILSNSVSQLQQVFVLLPVIALHIEQHSTSYLSSSFTYRSSLPRRQPIRKGATRSR